MTTKDYYEAWLKGDIDYREYCKLFQTTRQYPLYTPLQGLGRTQDTRNLGETNTTL